MKSYIYTDAFLNRQDAANAREDFLKDYEMDIVQGKMILQEDEIKYLNEHYVVRIMVQSPQLEMDFE